MRIDWRERPPSEVTKAYKKGRVYLDGVDVTDGCFLADDETGEVGNYLRDESGHFYKYHRDDEGPALTFRKGNVEIRLPDCLCLHAILQIDGQPTKHEPRCKLAPASL